MEESVIGVIQPSFEYEGALFEEVAMHIEGNVFSKNVEVSTSQWVECQEISLGLG